jgi:hypothetical protein
MAMLAYDDLPRVAPVERAAGLVELSPPAEPELSIEPDDDVQERWLQAQPWPRRWFARFYRALRKLQPAFPPMSCC